MPEPTRCVHRSSQCVLAIAGCAMLAFALPIFGAFKESNPDSASAAHVVTRDGRWVEERDQSIPSSQGFIWLGAIAGVGAVGLELKARRQLDLVQRGKVAQAIVDEVHLSSGKYDHNWVKYGFIADDGKAYHGKCTIGAIEGSVLTTGLRVAVFYDPARPKRNLIEQALWMVEWTEPQPV